MKLNTPVHHAPIFNNEGIKAVHINPRLQLLRLTSSCMLWEDEFYVDGLSIAHAIRDTIPQVKPQDVAEIAIQLRNKMKLRHVPLLVVREMARIPTHKHLVAKTLAEVIQRPDEIAEFCAIWQKDQGGKSLGKSLSAQAKKGLAKAFNKFNEFEFAKYDRDGAIKLNDVMFLVHPKPLDGVRGFRKDARKMGNPLPDGDGSRLFKKIATRTLPVPNTWESRMVGGEDKKAVFEDLLQKRELGALALLRNLRGMSQAGVPMELIKRGIREVRTERVLPFRFITAARHAMSLEPELEEAMYRCIEGRTKLGGRTVMLIDTSPSMSEKVSAKSEMSRTDAALGVAILARELFENIEIWAFSSSCAQAPSRRGFALGDAILKAVPSNGTLLGNAIQTVSGRYDRLLVFTDEESQDAPQPPDAGTKAYLVNVASSRNGIGYGSWVHMDGFSEHVLSFIEEAEAMSILP